jgi:hypothetical protein
MATEGENKMDLTIPTQVKSKRPDPTGFVLSIALALFTLTMIAVLTTHLAVVFGWQVM